MSPEFVNTRFVVEYKVPLPSRSWTVVFWSKKAPLIDRSVPFEAAGVAIPGVKDVRVGGVAMDPHPPDVYASRYPVSELYLNIPIAGV
jgi:hypothetical protein